MKRRHLIELSAEEQARFLAEHKTIALCSIDHRGYPHVIAMWYEVAADGSVLMTTYAKSQKARNIERNPKVALMAESGATYDQLKGVMIRGRAELIRDLDQCVGVLTRIHQKMGGALVPGIEEAMKAQARKRVVIRVVPERTGSWDHSKLGGVY
ncbi:MAG: pyridoxamine 5'-phosphate oxidase family protein [Deltaproteobacteria bacterium]|nr:pyridoxamine 5'-phosphate oxidase family protein [Deltaproteobacteria bacterium]